MADFGAGGLSVNYNNSGSATDSAATFTGTALQFSGSGGAMEMRFASSGGGATSSTPSASWPYMTRPASGQAVVPQCWAFTTDTSGTQVATYDGTSGHYKQFIVQWDNSGTYASQPQFSWFGDTTLTTPTPGNQTQQGTVSASPIVNGSAGDTSPDGIASHSTSYMKMNAYGRGTAASGSVQDTPSSNAGGTLSVTSGTAGALQPPVTPAWLASSPGWQSGMGWLQYIQDAVVPQATLAGNWYMLFVLYTGAAMATGTMLPIFVYQYTFT